MKKLSILLALIVLLATGCTNDNTEAINDNTDNAIENNIEENNTNEENTPEEYIEVVQEESIDGTQFLDGTPATYFLSGNTFKNGTLENVVLDEDNHLVLTEGSTTGYFESQLISAEDFLEAIASWNVNTSKVSDVEVSVQVGTSDEMSEYMTYGKWSVNGLNKGSIDDQANEVANINIDTIKMNPWKIGTRFKIKIELLRDTTSDNSPIVRELMFSTTLATKTKLEYTLPDIDIEVPERSQMIIPDIGSKICSPTSLSMLMAYQGVVQTPEEVANSAKDRGSKLYGNWSYNVAHAGEYDLRAYVRKVDTIAELVEIVESGVPVAASIKTPSIESLVGAPMAYNYGHLLVVRGFTSDGYVIVNDPASPDDESVRREYKINQFKTAWNGYIYYIEANN